AANSGRRANRTGVGEGFALADLAELFGAEAFGDGLYRVVRPASVEDAKPGDLVLAETAGQVEACTRAGAAALTASSLACVDGAANGIACADPALYFNAAHRLFAAHDDLAVVGEGLWIAPDARVHRSARLAPGCVVQSGACIEAHAGWFPGVVVERGALVGAGCILRSRAVIGRDAVIGPLCEIGSGTVVGADPQQFVAADGVWTRKPLKTRARLGARVAVGANSVIESGARSETVIESDVLIGGQVYVAHDCRIARGVLI